MSSRTVLERIAPQGARREWLLHAGLLFLLLVPIFPGTFLRGELIAPGDLLFQSPPWSHYAPPGWKAAQNPLMPDIVTAFHPYYVLTKEALRNGEWPLWNQYELSGMPLLANSQTAVFYPPRLLHAFLDVELATTLYILLKLWLCGMTAFFCGRALGMGLPAARFLSVGWMLASYNVIWCNWSLPDITVWFPVLFTGVEFIIEGRNRRGFALTAVGGTLILLAGHPETAFAMSLGLGIYFFLRLALNWRRGQAPWTPIAVCAAAWAVALLVCAAQLLPFIEYLAHSETLTERPKQTRQTWLSFGSAAAFWIPRFFGTSADRNYWGNVNSNLYSMLYPGIAVWLGAFLLFTKGERNFTGRARAIGLALASLVGVLLSFNSYPLDFINSLPLFSSMIVCYHIGFTVFALPFLGAMGVEWWWSRPRKVRELLPAVGGALAAAAVVAFLYSFNSSLIRAMDNTRYVHVQLLLGLIFAVLGLIVLGLHTRIAAPRALAAVLTAILAIDLLIATRGLNPTLPRRHLYPETELTRYLKDLGQPCRIGLGEGGIASGIMAAYGIEDWLGYDGLYPERMHRFLKRRARDWWGAMEQVCAIAYYLNDPRFPPPSDLPLNEPGRLEHMVTLDGLEVYKNHRAFPRAYLVGRLTSIPDVELLLTAMSDPAFDPRKTLLTERPPGGRLPESVAEARGHADIVSYASTRVTVRVNAAQDCYLVLADAYYPGWEATLDGEPVEIFPANYAFRGVVVPAGEHTVEFRLRPWSFRAGLGISIAALIVGALVGLRQLRRGGRHGRNGRHGPGVV